MTADAQSSSPLIPLADIAVLANVGRPAVSNWRKRFADFPEPVAGTAANPLFDARQVEEWLRQKDRFVGRPGVEHRLWQAMEPLRGVAPMEALLEAVAAVATLRFLALVPLRAHNLAEGVAPAPGIWHAASASSPSQWLHDLLRAAIELEAASPSLHGLLVPPLEQLPPDAGALLHAVDEVRVEDSAELVEAVIGMLRRATGRGGSERITAAPLVDLMVDMARPIVGTVYDGAAGVGGALREAARAANGAVRLIGQEVNAAACRLANQRLIVHGLDGHIALGDTLLNDLEPEVEASLVVLDPPYGVANWGTEQVGLDRRWRFGAPSDSSADLAWVQHAVSKLAPGGRAFVLQPASTLFRAGADARIRHELIRQGAVEAVIALPGGVASHTGMALSLWVLARPGEAAGEDRVLLADATVSGIPFTARARDVAALYRLWRREGVLGDVGWAVSPTRLDLLGIDETLLPSRWIPTALETKDAHELAAEVQEDAERLAGTLRQLGTARGAQLGGVSAADADVLRTTVDRLVTDGVLELIRGPRVFRGDLGPEDPDDDDVAVITQSEVRSALALHLADCPRVHRTALAHQRGVTEVGDVVVMTDGPRIRASVVRERGAVASAPLVVLRVRPERMNPVYLATCLTSEWNARHLAGSGVPRANVRDLEVPLMTLGMQNALGERLLALEDVRRQSLVAEELAESITQRIADGLVAGLLAVDLDVPADG